MRSLDTEVISDADDTDASGGSVDSQVSIGRLCSKRIGKVAVGGYW